MTDQKPHIFGFPQSTYVRTVRMTCEEKGIDYELVPMGFSSEGLPEKHPFRRIPAFEHNDLALYETSAICRYIDAAFDGQKLTPDHPSGQAVMEKWISVANAYVDPPVIRKIVMERVVKPMLGKPVDEQLCADAVPDALHALGVIDSALRDSDYLAGPDLSLADLFLVPMIFYFRQMPEGKSILPEVPHLEAWYERMEKRESFVRTLPPPTGER